MPARVKCLHALMAHELAVARRESAGHEEAGRCRRGLVGGRPVRAAASAREEAEHDVTGGRDRLRHELDPAAHRRRGPGPPRPSPTSTGGWRSSGSAQGVDKTGRLAPEALERTLAALARVRRPSIRPAAVERRADGRDQRHQGRRQRGRVHPRRGRDPRRRARGTHRRRGGAPLLRGRDRRARRPMASRPEPPYLVARHRRRLDRVRARRRRPRPARTDEVAASRWTSAASG